MKFSTYYFHVKIKILAHFQICISVPLIVNAELLTPLFKKFHAENLLRKIFMILEKLKEDLLFFSLEMSFYNQLFSLNQQFQVL